MARALASASSLAWSASITAAHGSIPVSAMMPTTSASAPRTDALLWVGHRYPAAWMAGSWKQRVISDPPFGLGSGHARMRGGQLCCKAYPGGEARAGWVLLY